MRPTELAQALREIEDSASPGFAHADSDAATTRFSDERAYDWFDDVLESAPQPVVDWFLAILPPIADHLEEHHSLEGFNPQDHVIIHLHEQDAPLLRWLSRCPAYLNQALKQRPANDYELFDYAQRHAIENCSRAIIGAVDKLL